MNKKNVIIIMIDGGRFDRSKKSLLFQSIKQKSICLSQSITYGPHTIAAMHAVFSGTYGSKTGTNSYWSTYKFKKEKFKTISEYLHDKNYYTVADVVNKLVIPQQGLDEFNIHDEQKDDLTILHADYLKKMKKLNDNGKKFFLYLQYSNIHTGIMNEVLKIYDNFSTEFFENKLTNEKRYDKLFSNAEEYLEKMLNKIYELELDKNSIILIMSDHGISVGEKMGERAYGAFCYDYTLQTLAYFLLPKFQPIEIIQQTRTIDFMPTILDYLGISFDSQYDNIDGESLMPLFFGNSLDEKIAFSETGNPLKEKSPPKEPNIHSVRTSDWKLIFNSHDNSKELYDLKNDPNENCNLSETNLEIKNILWKEILKYL
jgi:arylsulfatase A-like enzyme